MVKKYILSLLFCLLCGFAFSQHAVLKGFTYDEASGESLPYCTIQLMGTSFGALSDATGAFLINKIPAGTYAVKVSRMGYEDLIDTITVGASGNTTKRYSISPNSQTLDAVQIVGENTRKELDKYFVTVCLENDSLVIMTDEGNSPYSDYNVRGIDHRLEMGFLWVWPWDNSVRLTITEARWRNAGEEKMSSMRHGREKTGSGRSTSR